MQIGAYLNSIEQRVVSCQLGDSAQEVAKRLTDADIGAMPVVCHEGKIVGMISERDLTNRLSTMGSDVITLKVDDMLSKSVTFMGPSATLSDAFNTMRNRKFRHIPILDAGEIIGVISIRDVLEEFALEVGALEDVSEELQIDE
ncbi:MAG: CBS domain-containing protein [Pseudomonadota bacterium]